MTPTTPLSIWGTTWRGVRVFVVLPIAILVSLANDIRFACWGTTTDAHLVSSVRGRWGRPNNQAVYVEYVFQDKIIGSRRERDELPYWFDEPKGEMITIQYIEGSAGHSRVEGNHDWYWMFATIICGVIGVIAIRFGSTFAARQRVTVV